MKGILIFNRINDLIFVKHDNEFSSHIHSLGVKNGLVSENGEHNGGINRNVVVQIFSPLVASQRVMQVQLKNCYVSTECQDGTFFVFAEYVGYVFIQITRSDDSGCMFSKKNLFVFVELVKFLCGVSVGVLSDSCATSHDGCHAHRLLLLVDMWEHLLNTQQMYLLEGIERLLVNPGMSSTCIDILETVLAKMRATNKGTLSFSHAFLLVGTKLLALFSSRNAGEISKGSLLQVIALSQALHSVGKSPTDSISSSSISQSTERRSRSAPASPVKSTALLNRLSISAKFLDDSSCGFDTADEAEANAELVQHLQCQLVFLKVKQQSFVPHVMYSLNVNGQLRIVIICEVTNKTLLSSCLANCLTVLHAILNGSPTSRGQLAKTSLVPAFQKLSDAFKKSKASSDLDRFGRNVLYKWDVLKHSGLLNILQKTREPLTPPLEALLSGLCQSLQDAFENLILKSELRHQVEPQTSTLSALRLARCLVQKKLRDYLDYLAVKALRNITMTSYLQDYPGLLHFIYIDRSSNYMLAPSVGDSVQIRQEYVASLTKANVWKMVETTQRHLQKGDLGLLWQDENFCYSYCLWFEDMTGKPLKPKKIPNFKALPLPGIICGDFYGSLVAECFPTSASVQCFELYCIHVGVATPPFILDQNRRLASSIWETASLVNALITF